MRSERSTNGVSVRVIVMFPAPFPAFMRVLLTGRSLNDAFVSSVLMFRGKFRLFPFSERDSP